MRPSRLWRDVGGVAVFLALLVAGSDACARGPACGSHVVPESAEAVVETVAACRADNRLAEAIPPLRAWLARRPDDHARRQALAELLKEAGDLEGAAAEYDRLLEASGDRDLELRKARADVLAWSGRLEEAIGEYRDILRVDPRQGGAWLGLGLALGWRGDPGESEAALRQALRIDPNDGEAAKALDALLASPAWQAWRAEAARQAAPDDPSRWANAIDALVAAERWWDAEPLAAEAVRRWPAEPQLASLAARVETRRRQRLASALGDARTRLARDPNDRDARLAAAQALAALGDARGARTEYEDAHRRWPADEAIARALARQASYMGDTGRALALYADLVAAYPDDTALRLERARVLGWDGQLEESAAEFARLREAAPAAAARGLADSYHWGGHRGMASKLYRDAARLDPGGAEGEAAAAFFTDEANRFALSSGWQWVRDSDDFRRWRLGVEASQRLGVTSELALGFAHADYAQHAETLRAERTRLSVLADVLPRLRLALSYGLNVYDDTLTHSGAAEATAVLGPETTVALAYDHYDIVDEVLTVASVLPDPRDPDRQEPIESDRLRVAGRTILPWRLELAGNAAFAWYDDGNRFTQVGASLGRRVLRRPWVRLAWDINYLSYSTRSRDAFGRSRYWDPPDYLSNGFAVQARHSLRDWLRLGLDGRIGWGSERGTGSLERAVGTSIELGPIAGITLECGGRWGQTARGSGKSGGYEIWSAWATLRWQGGRS